jgi:Uma2 family endonuclease
VFQVFHKGENRDDRLGVSNIGIGEIAMTLATDRRMSLEEYLEYDDGTDTRYELEDGVLIEMGAENPLNPAIASLLFAYFFQMGIPSYRLVIGHQVGVSSTQATSRQPDLVVHTEASEAAIQRGGKILFADMPAPMLVVEVVSNSDTDKKSRDRDYTLKRSEYAERGIPEYWIVDPVAAVVLVLHLDGGVYQEQRFTGDMAIASPTFPVLKLTATQVLSAGRPSA